MSVALLAGPAVLALWVARQYHLGVAGTLTTVLLSGGGLASLYLNWKIYLDGHRDQAGLALAQIADGLASAVRRQAETAGRLWPADRGLLPVSWVCASASLFDSWDSVARLAAQAPGRPRLSPPAGWARTPGALAGAGGDLADVLDRVPTGRLVVLGGPGAGKTVLMTRLVLDLLARRSAGDPVPVLLSVASWNPRQQSLPEWLKRRLTEEFPGLSTPTPAGNAAEALLDARLILPILDGLDEVPDALRGLAISQLNAAMTVQRLVVSCRTEAYRDAVRPSEGRGATLLGAAGIELCPLRPAEVADYLSGSAADPDTLARWKPVTSALTGRGDGRRGGFRAGLSAGRRTAALARPVGRDVAVKRDRTDRLGDVLARVLSVPLMASLAHEIYNLGPGEAPDPVRLAQFTHERDLEHHLLEAKIAAAYRAAGPQDRPGRADRAERWLTFLAVHAQSTGATTDIAWWRLAEALPRRVAALVVGGASFVSFGLAGWVAGGRQYGLLYGLAYGLAFGLAGALSFGSRACQPSRAQIRFRGSALTILGRGALGTAIGLLFAAVIGQPTVLIAGAAFGLLFGTHKWLKTPAPIGQVLSPSDTLRQDRAGTLWTGLVAGLAFGTAGGLDVAASISSPGPSFGGFTGVAVGVLCCGAAGAFLGRLEYGLTGLVTYGFAGGVVGLLATAWTPPVTGLGPGLAYGLAFGLSIAMAMMASRAWASFQITRILLAVRGDQPWRIMAFLEDARRRGLLRRSGAVYQFRHARLHEHLAGGASPRGRRWSGRA